MPNSQLDTFRAALQAARRATTEAQQKAASLRERLARIDRQLKALPRSSTPREAPPRQRALEAERAEVSKAYQAQRESAADARKLEKGAVERFAVFTDPRQTIGLLDDRLPFLLFPVRLETRFKGSELWVRIYPDDLSIDTFEATLTETEVKNGQRYWSALWAAAGDEGRHRAAWRNLVASHGSGRAEWIVGHYLPSGTPTPAPPPKARPEDVILVIPTETELPAAEALALETYWKTRWLADGDFSAQAGARAALESAVGEARAEALIDQYSPINLDELPPPPHAKTQVTVTAVLLRFPSATDTQRTGWSRAPFATLLPDRFVFIGESAGADPVVVLGKPVPSTLVTGPDPYAAPEDSLAQNGGDLEVPESMRWMVDFPTALEVGMGLKIPLSPSQRAQGFDRVLVVGVRLSSDPLTAKAELQALLKHHRLGRSGLGLVPQGTPTNNTDGSNSGWSRVDDPDESFDLLFSGADYPEESDPLDKRDGQRLAEALGLDASFFKRVANAGGRDGADAVAMNRVLWPATLGYWMRSLMSPVFKADAVEQTREFFTGYVTGRGPLSAIRIGKQPYGILPTTAFSRMGWFPRDRKGLGSYLRSLWALLGRLEADWDLLAAQVAFTGKQGDPHRLLLDIVGLHPTSAELSSRLAQSTNQIHNQLLFMGGGALQSRVARSPIQGGALELLARLGYVGTEKPELLKRLFKGKEEKLKGPVIDDAPLSETLPIRASTTSGTNYLQWLLSAARTSLNALYRQSDFIEGPPSALLYLMVRHALQLGYHDSSLRAHLAAGVLTESAVALAHVDSPFIHVATDSNLTASESKYAALFKSEAAITGSPSLNVSDWITSKIGIHPSTTQLNEQLAALERLKDASTGRLERAFIEHIDLCAYRLDAWSQGLVTLQLEQMRAGEGATGLHLGAYAWLENLRPQARQGTAVELEPELAKEYQRRGDSPLMRDSTNGGFVHAPSENHAVAAAVLRNGYLSNASPSNRRSLAVNLTSERVRKALAIFDGAREGQSLGALLGYQLERGLHDRHGFAEVDQYIYKLRRAFPLSADKMASTRTDTATPIEAIEARNVVDGLALVQQIRATGQRNYPFGKTLPDPQPTPTQAAEIDAEVALLLETHDAVADLAMAEGVYQAVIGNSDRAAGMLDAVSRGNTPPEPDVIRTPSPGVGLTHRLGLQLDPSLGPDDSPVSGVPMSPRARTEPSLNGWLASMLPDLSQVGLTVSGEEAAAGSPFERTVTLRELRLQPLDLLYLVRGEGQQAMTELDDRVLSVVRAAVSVRGWKPLNIAYTQRGTARYSLFEILPLLSALRSLVTLSRPLKATDLALSNEAKAKQDGAPAMDRSRIAGGRATMLSSRGEVEALRSAMAAPLADQVARRAELLAGVDGWLTLLEACLASAARFGLPQAGWGFAFAAKEALFQSIRQKVAIRAERWAGKLAVHDTAVAEYDAAPSTLSDTAKRELLQRAYWAVTTDVTTPRPDALHDFRATLPPLRAAFVAKRAQLAALSETTRTKLSELLGDVQALLPVAAFDLDPLDFADEEAAVIRLVEDMAAACGAVVKELDRRLAASKSALDAHDGAASPEDKVEALTSGAKALYGDEYVILPRFALGPAQGHELAQALSTSQSGELFRYLVDDLKMDFPVDTWMYGLARVREKVHRWERVTMLAGAFERLEPELTALQLPALPQDRWAALQIPESFDLTTDRLLYTAHFARPFSKTDLQCGLLLDEWTEVIPRKDLTTGVTFHFDRPNNEAPQTLLLVTPPAFSGAWQWPDLVDALTETLQRAKRRAVEPEHLERTPYAQLIPATVTATTVNQLTISTVLALNNQVELTLQKD